MQLNGRRELNRTKRSIEKKILWQDVILFVIKIW